VQRRLRESERWLAATARSIGDSVIATDGEWRVRFMNPAAEKLTGWQGMKRSVVTSLRSCKSRLRGTRAHSPQTTDELAEVSRKESW
jgi:PAS domain-containing protein